MKIKELKIFCQALEDQGLGERDIRLGDQIESGPYMHSSVGGLWLGSDGSLILSHNDDEAWKTEEDPTLIALWQPPRESNLPEEVPNN